MDVKKLVNVNVVVGVVLVEVIVEVVVLIVVVVVIVVVDIVCIVLVNIIVLTVLVFKDKFSVFERREDVDSVSLNLFLTVSNIVGLFLFLENNFFNFIVPFSFTSLYLAIFSFFILFLSTLLSNILFSIE